MKMKLECMQSYQIFGNVASLQSVQLAGSQRDALLLSFQEAKVDPETGISIASQLFLLCYSFMFINTKQLSVVEYDPGTHDLKTLSLHFFEDEDIKVEFLYTIVVT